MVLDRRLGNLTEIRRRFQKSTESILKARMEMLKSSRSLLRTLGPEATFQRGFSITLDADGKLLRSATQIRPGMRIRTKLIDGEFTSEISK